MPRKRKNQLPADAGYRPHHNKKQRSETRDDQIYPPDTYRLRLCSDGTFHFMPTLEDLMRMYEEDEDKATGSNSVSSQESQNVSENSTLYPREEAPENSHSTKNTGNSSGDLNNTNDRNIKSCKKKKINKKKKYHTVENSDGMEQHINVESTNENNSVQDSSNKKENAPGQINENQEYIIMVQDSQNSQDPNQQEVVYINPSVLPKKPNNNNFKVQRITANIVLKGEQVNFAINFENDAGTVTQAGLNITKFFTDTEIDLMRRCPQVIEEISDVFGNLKRPNSSGPEESFIVKKKLANMRYKYIGECPICLDVLGKSDLMSTLCGHIFCMPCIRGALAAGDSKCPSCRKKIRNLHTVFI